MKKITIAASILLLSISFLVNGADSTEKSGSTPVKFSVWPGVAQWPTGLNTYGISFGFPASYDSPNTYVAGVDFALSHSTSNVKGIQNAVLITGSNSDGIQFAIANIVDMFYGVEFGVYNEYKNSKGLQIGLINKGTSSKGVQIGLINMLDNGFFPTFPIFNFSNTK